MPSKTHETYRADLRKWFRTHAHEPDVRPQLERYEHAAQVLWDLDLGAARPVLERCYANNPRGGRPRDPVVILRLMLLACLVDQPKLNQWVPDLEANRVLLALGGVNPDEKRRPGVGTFYDFMHRLHDGPVRKTCPHIERPSELERRRAATPRTLKRRKPKHLKKKTRRQRGVAAKKSEAEMRSVTARLTAELEAMANQPSPDSLLTRLGTILIEVAVMESARRGLLGDLDKLVVGGDGSMLETGANQHGHRVCQHPREKRCDCPRTFSDPDAEWGWDSHREIWFFGHHFYELSTSAHGHDLPLAIAIFAGNCSDFTASLHAYELLRKLMSERLQTCWSPQWFLGDAGHDAEPIYRYMNHHGTKTVIPLKAPARATHPSRPEVALSKRAVPLCQAGAEMAHWGSAGQGRVNFLCPVRAGKLDRCPMAPEDQPDWHCRPDQRYGPTLTVRTSENPRLFPHLPRNNPRFQELYNYRSGCERSNSVKKETFSLERARHRRSSFWLIRLHLIGILQHARTWVMEGEQHGLVEYLLGGEELAAAA